MFTQGKTHGTAARVGGILGAVALGAGLTVIAPISANADNATASYAEARFLSGSLVGIDLDQVVELAAARAANDGTQSLQTSKDPLSITALQALNIDVPGGVQVGADGADAGVINQYAEADKNGVSFAAAGAIGDDGGVGVGSVGSGAAGDLNVDLNTMLDGSAASVLTDLTLSLEAVSAQARGALTEASGDYTLSGATLTFSSPAIGSLTSKVNTALSTVDQSLLGLEGDDGVLGNAVDGVLDPVLGVVGSSANVTATIDTDLQSAVQSLLDGGYGNGAVSFNLENGTVSVDLETLLGSDLNNLPPNTELLTDAVISQVLTGITDTVSALADQIVNRVEAALHNANVNVHADLDLLTSQGTTQTEECHVIDVPIIGDILGDDGLGGLLGDDGLGGLLGGLLGGGSNGGTGGGTGGVTQGIIGWTTQTVCDLVDTVLPSLQSTVNVDINGTVDELLNGTATNADASISLLGGTVNSNINLDLVLDELGDGLLDGLFAGDGAVSDLIDALNSGLVNPAVTGLLGDGGVDTILTDLLSVRVNVQETDTTSSGSTFTETAVRVSVLGGLGSGGAATVNVAAATVGPNVTRVIDPGCTVNCNPGGDPDPDCVTNCGNGGGGTTPSGSGGGLAFTGLNIATLVMIILALLITGAYFAREGYRRNHSRPLAGV